MAILDPFKKKSAAPAKKEAAAKGAKADKAAPATETAEKALVAAPVRMEGGLAITEVLVRPYVTERSTDLSERGVYAFLVHNRATKPQIALAVRTLYKVTPEKIAVMRVHAKMMKNRKSNQSVVKRHAYKKALVYLKSGDKIEVV
ncbi:MAG TPA: 50S ribosomal protein L23 [Candidatus Paceibacterota bacterium]|nr:50S ribosomal protein L23 [Candidatus Paceibacterota bacterium]